MKLLYSFTIATALMGSVITSPILVSPAFAQSAESSATSRVECTTGSYGQNVNCVATAEANATARPQVVVRQDGTVLPAHTPVDAALDAKTLFALFSVLSLGAGSLAYKAVRRA